MHTRSTIIVPGDRFTGTINPTGTETFRCGSRQVFDTYGCNTQNISHRMRKCIIADPGNVIVYRDQSGAEAKIVAYESDCYNMKRCFELEVKPHTLVALNIFIKKFLEVQQRDSVYFKPPDDLVKLDFWKELNHKVVKSGIPYFLGKKTVHACDYMMGWHTFQVSVLEESKGSIRLTPEEAKEMIASFFRLFPEVKVWQEMVRVKLEKEGVLYNLLGEPRIFTRRHNMAYIRSAVAFIAQSTVGEITNHAAIEFQKGCKPNWVIHHNGHDALGVECPKGDAEECADFLSKCMDVWLTTTDGKRTFQMTGETHIGERWSEQDT